MLVMFVLGRYVLWCFYRAQPLVAPQCVGRMKALACGNLAQLISKLTPFSIFFFCERPFLNLASKSGARSYIYHFSSSKVLYDAHLAILYPNK